MPSACRRHDNLAVGVNPRNHHAPPTIRSREAEAAFRPMRCEPAGQTRSPLVRSGGAAAASSRGREPTESTSSPWVRSRGAAAAIPESWSDALESSVIPTRGAKRPDRWAGITAGGARNRGGGDKVPGLNTGQEAQAAGIGKTARTLGIDYEHEHRFSEHEHDLADHRRDGDATGSNLTPCR